MAINIFMLKEYEDREKFVYSYGPNDQLTVKGKIEYNKEKKCLKS